MLATPTSSARREVGGAVAKAPLIVRQSVPSPFMRLAVLRRGLAAVVLLWAASLLLAAFAASGHAGALAYGFAATIYAIGSQVCHQRPERSFHLWAVQLPVCARCTGIYFGAAAAAFARPRPIARPLALLLASSAPAAATLVYEWTTGAAPANWIRALTGLLIGASVLVVIAGELNE